MENFTTYLIILGLLFFLIVLLVCSIQLELSPDNDKLDKPLYLYDIKRHLMTQREERFFLLLNTIFGSEYYIIPQVHLSTLFEHKIRGQNWRAAFYHINGKSVDFVLLDKRNLKPVCAVELDDSTHDSQERQERDLEVERIFERARFPLIRIRHFERYTEQEIADIFEKTMNPS